MRFILWVDAPPRPAGTVRRVGARIIGRLRRHVDILVALVLAGVALLPPDPDPSARTRGLLGAALLLAATLPVAVRRRWPLAVLVTVSAALAAYGALNFADTVAWLSLGVAGYTVAAAHEPRVSFPWVGGCATVALAAPALGGTPLDGDAVLGGLLLFALPTLLGDRVSARREAAQLAARAERERIARELHDSVAHALSVIVVQADAADAMLDRDPGRARRSLEAIRDTGRQSLDEMRRLVGALRAEDTLAPLPGLRELPALVEQLRGSGVDAALVVEGDPYPLAPVVEASAYRIVQEALTNVRRHARAHRTRVLVRFEPGDLVVEVTDDGRGAHAQGPTRGNGLVGMGERARLCGGVFHAGTRDDGGFEVAVRLPAGTARG